MATVLLTWELGAGIGHLMNLRPIGQTLVERGHRVIAAVKELTHVRQAFKDTGISFIAAPTIPLNRKVFSPMRGLAHILGNIGLAHEDTFATLFEAWNAIYDHIGPDLVVADHSPNALLALHGRGETSIGGCSISRVNVGLGFFCPPDMFPLPFWLKPNEKKFIPQILEDERGITNNVNLVLQAHNRRPLQRLSQIYGEVQETFLATYPEFDHFGPRPKGHGDVKYWGHWPYSPGIEPRWPSGTGPKIYAYLKPFPALEFLLGLLCGKKNPTLVLSGGISPAIQKRYSCPTLRFEQTPLDLRLVGRQCDLAILNSGHGTTVSLLLAGKPSLQLPLYAEQLLFAQKVDQLKLGRSADVGKASKIAAALNELLEDPGYTLRAREFSKKYAALRPGAQIPEIASRLESLMRT